MSTVAAQLKVMGRNWKVGLWVGAFPLLILLLMFIFSLKRPEGNLSWVLLSWPILAGGLGVFVGESQKEMLCKGLGVTFPGMIRTMERSQTLIMALVWVGVFLASFLLPENSNITRGLLLQSANWATFCLIVYSAFYGAAILIERSASINWAALIYCLFYLVRLGVGTNWSDLTPETRLVTSLVNATWGVTVAGIALLGLGLLVFRAADLPRYLTDSPYLSPVDLFRFDKVRIFKRRSEAHFEDDTPRRPLQGLMNWSLSRVRENRHQNRPIRALMWESIYLGLSTSISRKWFTLVGFFLSLILMMVLAGYYDGYLVQCRPEGMVGWFPAFPYFYCSLPLLAWQFMVERPVGLVRSRPEMIRSGYGMMLITAAAVLVLSLVILGLNFLLAAILPDLENSSFLAFNLPHVPFLPILIFPVALVLFLQLKRFHGSLLLNMAWMQTGILLHALLSIDGHGWALWVVGGISGISWLILPWVWRRRIENQDW